MNFCSVANICLCYLQQLFNGVAGGGVLKKKIKKRKKNLSNQRGVVPTRQKHDPTDITLESVFNGQM